MKEFIFVNNHNGKKFKMKGDRVNYGVNSIYRVEYGAIVIGQFSSENFSYYIKDIEKEYNKIENPIKSENTTEKGCY